MWHQHHGAQPASIPPAADWSDTRLQHELLMLYYTAEDIEKQLDALLEDQFGPEARRLQNVDRYIAMQCVGMEQELRRRNVPVPHFTVRPPSLSGA